MHVLTHISIGVYIYRCVFCEFVVHLTEKYTVKFAIAHIQCAVSPTRQRMQAEKDEIINRAKSKVSYLKNPFI